jgi:DNA repair exonuclease SbcCD ATPase subunit
MFSTASSVSATKNAPVARRRTGRRRILSRRAPRASSSSSSSSDFWERDGGDDDDDGGEEREEEEETTRRRGTRTTARGVLALSLSAILAGGGSGGFLCAPCHASLEDSRRQVILDIERRLELEGQSGGANEQQQQPRPRWETKAEERAMMMREYDRLAIKQKEEKEEFNRKATAVYARQAAERKTLARIEKEGNPDGLSQSEKERVAKEEGEKAYEMTMNAIDASELELKAYNERMEERRRTALERNREELEKLEEMESEEKEQSAMLEQIEKNCEKSLEDVNPFDDTVCI